MPEPYSACMHALTSESPDSGDRDSLCIHDHYTQLKMSIAITPQQVTPPHLAIPDNALKFCRFRCGYMLLLSCAPLSALIWNSHLYDRDEHLDK